jgi:hypothetical protein
MMESIREMATHVFQLLVDCVDALSSATAVEVGFVPSKTPPLKRHAETGSRR